MFFSFWHILVFECIVTILIHFTPYETPFLPWVFLSDSTVSSGLVTSYRGCLRGCIALSCAVNTAEYTKDCKMTDCSLTLKNVNVCNINSPAQRWLYVAYLWLAHLSDFRLHPNALAYTVSPCCFYGYRQTTGCQSTSREEPVTSCSTGQLWR